MAYILSKQKESPNSKNCISDEVQDKDLMSTLPNASDRITITHRYIFRLKKKEKAVNCPSVDKNKNSNLWKVIFFLSKLFNDGDLSLFFAGLGS